MFARPQCPYRRKPSAYVPKYYMPQVQMVMEICDLETTDFIQYWPHEGSLMHIKTIPRDRGWFATNLPRLERFHAVLLQLRNDSDMLLRLRAAVDDGRAHRLLASMLDPRRVQAAYVKSCLVLEGQDGVPLAKDEADRDDVAPEHVSKNPRRKLKVCAYTTVHAIVPREGTDLGLDITRPTISQERHGFGEELGASMGLGQSLHQVGYGDHQDATPTATAGLDAMDLERVDTDLDVTPRPCGVQETQ